MSTQAHSSSSQDVIAAKIPGAVPHLIGTIRKLRETYGFIACIDGVDYFFHWSSMSKGHDFRLLEERDRVEFVGFPQQVDEDGKKVVKMRGIEVTPLN